MSLCCDAYEEFLVCKTVPDSKEKVAKLAVNWKERKEKQKQRAKLTEAQKLEDFNKENDDFTLYVLTPEMTGVYSVFEVAMDSCKRPGRVVACILDERNGKTFEGQVAKNMKKIKKDLINNGTLVFDNLNQVAMFFNTLEKKQTL